MTSPIPATPRPRPIKTAAQQTSMWLGAASCLLTVLTTYGAITVDQQSALSDLLAWAPALLAPLTAVLTAFGVLRQSESQVTPLADPQDAQGRALQAWN